VLVVVIVLAVVAVAAVIVALVTAARLREQRRLVAAGEERAGQQDQELQQAAQQLEQTRQDHAGALEHIVAADQRTSAAEASRDQARSETEAAVVAATASDERAAAAERRADEVAELHRTQSGGGVDAEVLWAMERQRSERVWRLSVATAPDRDPGFGAERPVLDALRVEVDAAREEVGAIVELDAELPDELTAAGSLLTLRAAQELLAGVVRRAEDLTLRVRADGADVVVAVVAAEDDGEPVMREPLSIPLSLDLVATEDGLRVRNAIA